MKKVAILDFKGGTGRTTTAVHLSHLFALREQSVPAVDYDVQGSKVD